MMFKRKGRGGSKAFWTMLKKTALFLKDGFPYCHTCLPKNNVKFSIFNICSSFQFLQFFVVVKMIEIRLETTENMRLKCEILTLRHIWDACHPLQLSRDWKSLLGRMHNVRNCTSNASDSFCDLENATFLLLILPILPNFISKRLPLDNLILLGVVDFIIQHLGCVPLLLS